MESRYREAGFTLIEIFVAMVIFALGMLALTKLQVVSISTNSYANQLSQGVYLARSTMERLLSLPYTDPDLTDSDGDGTGQDNNRNGIDDDDEGSQVDSKLHFGLNDATDSTADHHTDNVGPNSRYSIYWNIAVDQPIQREKRIRIIVKHRDNRNREHQVVLDCIKTDII